MALTYTYTDIPTTMVDADSPLTEQLMGYVEQDIQHNYEWLGQNYTPSADHEHNGTDSAYIATLANNFVTAPVCADGLVPLMNIYNPESTSSSAWTNTNHQEMTCIPTGGGTLNLAARLKTTQYGTAYARIYVSGGSTSTVISTTSTTYTWVYAGTLDVTSLAGSYIGVSVQILNTTTYTAYICNSHIWWS